MSQRGPGLYRDSWLWAILALGLGLRLIGLGEPLIDKQAWRQTDTAAIARNYYEEGYDLLYPRVDWRGRTEGYVETNFPLYPFLVACTYGVLGGVHEWVGRLFSALCSTAAAALLYLLAWRLYRNLWTARMSALFFLLFPLNIFFGRAFMPESTMLLLSIAALLGFDRWCQSDRWPDFALAAGLAALCFLVKIPTLYLGFPLVGLAWANWGWGFLKRPLLWGYLGLVLLPALLWHLHAYGLFEQTGLTFGIWGRAGYDKWSSDLLLSPDFYLIIGQRLWHSTFTPVGCILAILGLTYRGCDRREWMVHAWVGGLLLYLLLIPEGNRRLHYYQLPFVPLGALLAAKVLGELLKPTLGGGGSPGWLRWLSARTRTQRIGLVLLLVLGTGAYSAHAVRPYYRPPNNLYEYYRSCYIAGRILDQKLPPDALLVVGDIDENAGTPFRAQSPTLLYYCHRRGWQITPDEFSASRLDSLAGLGARYFVAAGGFVLQEQTFWGELVRRGITIPAEYPRFWTSVKEFDRARRDQRGPDRHFVVARLGRE